MTDESETAATRWQDQHSGKRGHPLMTGKLAETIPALYANEKVADYDSVLAHVKLFSPYSNWTWYVTEMDPATGTCFGLVEGLEKEMGYFDLTELAETTVFGGVPAVERDLYWEPKTLGEIKRGFRENTQHNGEIREGETMTDETGTEIHSQDVVNVEEFLLGGVTEEMADDALTDAEGEVPVGDPVEDLDADIAAEPDADTETAGQELEPADETGEQPTPSEMESAVALKVVLSFRGNRATIGVQQPTSDPHIETFDDPDLFGLADEFPAVVARAKARWEEAPQHPAYVKPAPPAKRQRQRQQATAQATADEGETDMEQQQPETLRLF